MNFDQTWILYGLPLALLPLVIHLLNRLRYRPKSWAAMPFLLKATKQSTKQARLRQFLILLCRMLAVLFLILALSKPRVGGWLGMAMSGPPRTVIVLLDRSASMELINPQTQKSKRLAAINLFDQALKQNGPGTRVVLIENALNEATELSDGQPLQESVLTDPTDTSADLVKMMEAALAYMLDNSTGRTEVWIASDLQRSNWLPKSPKWPALMAQFQELNVNVRFRLLALPGADSKNAGIQMVEVERFRNMGKSELRLGMRLSRSNGFTKELPLNITIDGMAPETIKLDSETSELRLDHRIRMAKDAPAGWGSATLPNDGNNGDNTAWFVYGADRKQKAAIFCSTAAAAKFLTIAAAPSPKSMNQEAKICKPEMLTDMDLSGYGLVIWQGALPPVEEQRHLLDYIEGGGMVLFMPDRRDAGPPMGKILEWGSVETAPKDEPFTITHWEQNEGPLADSSDGTPLPVNELRVNIRRRPRIEGKTLAEFNIISCPLLVRRAYGKGWIYASAVAPDPLWSNLHYGPVLVPMIQRLMRKGAARLATAKMVDCGQFVPKSGEEWRPVGVEELRDVRWHSGVYEFKERKIAVNRPLAESTPDRLTEKEATELFAGSVFTMFSDKGKGAARALPSEAWRIMLYCMLFVLLGEALLTVPGRREGGSDAA